MNGRVHRAPFIAGIVFVVLGVVFLLDQLDVIHVRAGYVLPVVLIAVGLAVLAGARSRGEPPSN